MKILVIYHGNCIDGFTAAWAASLALRRPSVGAEVTYKSAIYDKSPPPDVSGYDIVYILDFSYSKQVILEMKSKVRGLFLIDHHASAQKDCGALEDICYFNMEMSGAALSYSHFCNGNRFGKGSRWYTWNFPSLADKWLIDYVEDLDLFRFKLPRSQEVKAALASYEFTFDNWDMLHDKGMDAVADEGAAILRYENRVINSAMPKMHWLLIDGHRVPAVNTQVLRSEIANQLSLIHKTPFAVCWDFRDSRYVYSLRKNNERELGDIPNLNLSEIASKYGGGGHPSAASFTSTEFLKAGA